MIEIGQIVNTHGLKGDMKVKSNSDFKATRFAVGAVLYIDDDAYTVTKFTPQGGFDVLHLDGVESIEAALLLKNKLLFAPLDETQLADNEYHVSQLVGLQVMEAGAKIGVVEEILHYPAQAILVVGPHRIPFVDAFIKNVDLAKGVIDVELIEGL